MRRCTLGRDLRCTHQNEPQKGQPQNRNQMDQCTRTSNNRTPMAEPRRPIARPGGQQPQRQDTRTKEQPRNAKRPGAELELCSSFLGLLSSVFVLRFSFFVLLIFFTHEHDQCNDDFLRQKAEKRYLGWFYKAFIWDVLCSTNAVSACPNCLIASLCIFVLKPTNYLSTPK